jgi:hypothetical protein
VHGVDNKILVTILPTLASEINVLNGMSDKAKAADAAKPANASGITSSSKTLLDHYLNFCMVIAGKSGRKTRSTNLIVNTSLSLGLASLLKKPPGNRPAAANFSVIYRKW